jgi:hypothetical protein
LCRKKTVSKTDETDDDEEDKSPLPHYSCLRTVVIREVEVDGHEYVEFQCSCHSFIRHKRICRHVYRVVDWKPHYNHAFPECLKAYQSHIFGDDVSFQKCCKLTAMFKKFRALLLPGKLSSVGFRPIDTVNTLDWFLQAGDNLIDVNPRYEQFKCRGDLDVCVNPWEDDDYDDPDALLATPLVPAVPVAKRKGEAYETFMSEYTSVCQVVGKVDDDVREIVGRHFGNMRKELLQRLDQKSKNHVIKNGVASLPSLETAPKRLRKKPPGSPSRSRKRKRR